MPADVTEHLDYLSRVASDLGVADPLRDRLTDAIGRWSDLHDAAELWRRTADRFEETTTGVSGRLGGIDTSWQGADADAFLAHMYQFGLAGKDIVDGMRALALGLEHLAESLRTLVEDMSELVADSADAVSAALIQPGEGEQRARKHLEELDRPASELSDAVEEALRAFARFCDDFDAGPGVDRLRLDAPASPSPASLGASSPSGAVAVPDAAPSPSLAAAADAEATTPASAGSVGAPGQGASEGGRADAVEPSATPPAAGAPAAAAGGGAAVGGGMVGGMMPMGMMGGMGRNQAAPQRQNASRFKSNAEDLFGTPEKTPPPVLGEDPKHKK
jgi:uncharacterized protein YukE